MMKAMSGLFTNNQQSIDTTLEQVELSIAGIIEWVDTLESGLPPTDQDKLLDDTREDDNDEKECDRTTSGRGSLTRISLSDSWWSENTINTHKYNTIYCS
jgi:hypothetical protein